jgi:hypothetical protein
LFKGRFGGLPKGLLEQFVQHFGGFFPSNKVHKEERFSDDFEIGQTASGGFRYRSQISLKVMMKLFYVYKKFVSFLLGLI